MRQADVFERAYLSAVPPGARPLRGTSQNVLSHGVTTSLSSGTTAEGQVFAHNLPPDNSFRRYDMPPTPPRLASPRS